MNKLAKMLGVNDAEAGRQMNDSCFATEMEKVFYRCAYETRVGEMALNDMGIKLSYQI